MGISTVKRLTGTSSNLSIGDLTYISGSEGYCEIPGKGRLGMTGEVGVESMKLRSFLVQLKSGVVQKRIIEPSLESRRTFPDIILDRKDGDVYIVSCNIKSQMEVRGGNNLTLKKIPIMTQYK